jgi:hypothetical protein
MQKFEQNSTSNARSPFAGPGAGGVAGAASSDREPYEALDDLMCVVEALCPEWPARGIFQSSGKFLL